MLNSRVFYGWFIVTASFTNLFVIVGIVYYSFPVFYVPLIDEFGWTRTQVMSGYFFSILLIGPIFGISAGFLLDRYGARRIILAGLMFAGAAFLGFAFMHSLPAYYLFYFMQTIGYVSAGPISNQVLISHWFSRMRGRAMGLAYIGIGLGGAVAPVLTRFLIREAGWRQAMLAMGGIILIGLTSLTLALVKNRPSDIGLCPDGDPRPVTQPANPSAPAISLGGAIRTRAFWMILFGSLMSIGAVGGIIQHLQLYLRDHRFTLEHAAQVASFLLIASILGRVTMGYLADRFPRKYVMFAACLMVAAGILLLCFSAAPGAVYMFAFIFGFGMGADYMLIPLMTAECFGLGSLGRLMGVILTTDAVAQALAPVLVGRIFDLHQSYDWGLALLASMAILGALAVTLIPTHLHHQDTKDTKSDEGQAESGQVSE
ncbi:MAG TPA: MFS transporter [Acidobacteriota bacterium]